jgi:hypothetical protein
MARRRVFILDGAETMRWDVANVFLKILEEPPGSTTLILTAPSPYALCRRRSRCLEFHFAPLPQAQSRILRTRRIKTSEIKLAAQLAEPAPAPRDGNECGAASKAERTAASWNVPHAAKGFAQLSRTPALAKDRESSFEEQLGIFTACSRSPGLSRLRPVLRICLAKGGITCRVRGFWLGFSRHRRIR